MSFDARELSDMLLIYGETRGNAAHALRLYRERFPSRRHPHNARVITAALQRVRENSPIVPGQPEGAMNRIVPVQVEERILRHFRRVPTSSTRVAGRMFGTSNKTVHKILKRNRKHPFKFLKVQKLLPRDLPIRQYYCDWFLQKCEEENDFQQKIMWTDESTFSRNGMWNRRNTHYWNDKENNPHVFRETAHQYRWTVNVWAAIHNNKIIGPIFIDGTLNTHRFLDLINGPLVDYLNTLPEENRRETWYQLDGAPAHSTVVVRERLDQIFGQRVIGRFGHTHWPPRSPDLTPLDFFLWGAVKNEVFATDSETVDIMKDKITAAFRKLEENTDFETIRNSITRRYELCRSQGGRHIEHRV